MIQKIKTWVYGKPYAPERRPEEHEVDAKLYHRKFLELVNVPGHLGNPILVRARFLFSCAPGWKLILYKHESTDPLDLHNHAGRTLSLILKGGYWEERTDGFSKHSYVAHRKPFRFNWLGLRTFHAIRVLPKGTAWTLVLIWPNVQRVGMNINGEFKSVGRYYHEGLDRKALERAA